MTYNKLEWYEKTANIICDNIEDFYQKFYNPEQIKKIGSDSYRVNRCPVCGHNDCCTVKGNTVHCFSGSCDWSGTHINAWYYYATNIKGVSISEAIKQLDDYTGLKFPAGSKDDMNNYEKHQRQQSIMFKAEQHYHKQLMTCQKEYEYKGSLITPLNYMLNVRKRREDTLKHFKFGFSFGYLDLYHELLAEGYTKEEIKSARIWVPEGLFVFFYKHPITKDIVRINTKNPFKIRYIKKDEFQNEIQGDIIEGYSIGNKAMYFCPGFSFKKPFVIVEGEHDVAALWENGCANVCATGGNISVSDDNDQLKILDKAEAIIYQCFDNDSAGERYHQILNEKFPDKDIRKVVFPDHFKDIDEYYTSSVSNKKSWDVLASEAVPVVTENYRIKHEGNNWVIANRFKKLEFTIKGKNEKGQLIGTVSYYVDGKLNDREEDISLMKCKAKMKPFNFYLHDKIEEYFNSGLENKTIDELIDIYWYSSKKDTIIKMLAEALYKSGNEESLINKLKIKLKSSDGSENVIDAILKEVNDIQNKSASISFTDIPKMKICQYFNVKNNDAYMYFTYVKIDGDVKRKLPYLLRNDKSLIRLDLLKRKDSQCLLLVDNKYELPFEVNEAILDLRECSLTQETVEKYINGEIPNEELKPSVLIRQIEEGIRKFYYTSDDNTYKVLALYIYATYYYELFGQIPYLFLNGQKGSGKSILDTVIYMYAFDAKMAVDISESSLFRMVSIEGGTIILDEMENLTSRSKTQDSTMAAALKGGYSRSGSIYRFNKEKNAVEGFNVYGPKIISNIFGLEDVIADRCIQINTYRLNVTKHTKMEDPKYYLAEKLDEIRALTSRCAISALENFQELHKIYNNSLFETGNARLSQILTPIQATARLVDTDERIMLKQRNPEINEDELIGEYERALINFYNETLVVTKDDIDNDTPEGIIKRAVPAIAKELYGLVPDKDKEYTITSNHKYQEPIKHNIDEGWFEVNVIHFKCFIEEIMTGDTAFARLIPRWIKTVFKFKEGDYKRKVVTIENEDLIKEFKGNTKPKVYHYKFYFRDFIDISNEFLTLENQETQSNSSDVKDKLF
ncbi:MAG: toprim domain-containing protein [Clostridia bacterium]|nr:toprim domain-containing protein [Clostridia bacterium]